MLGLARDDFHRAGGKAWRGPCPRCGGNRHLLIFTDHLFPKWNCECQSCGLKAWADQLNAAVKVELTADEKRRFAEQRAAERAAAEKRRLEKLNEYSVKELLTHLTGRMTAEHAAWWEGEGVPASWQKYLRLGFDPARHYRGADDELCTSAAYSIPYYHTGFELVTVQYRLFDPPNPADRYRWEQGLGTAYYQTAPDQPIGDEVIICEGAKKGIVTAVHTPENYTVLAVPSKSDFGGIIEAVKNCGRVYVLLDPDAGVRSRKLAREIGPAARVASLPVKVDDGLTKYGLTDSLLQDALRVARPL
jgi:hypothetical protein